MTLIEVLAGLALLATLLVGVVLASVRQAQQIRAAQRRLLAITALERAIPRWLERAEGFPVGERGRFAEVTNLEWETRPLEVPEPNVLGLTVARVEVFDAVRQKGAAESRRALVGVDIALPLVAETSPPATRLVFQE
jgi:type II secretory pathway component PulJ